MEHPGRCHNSFIKSNQSANGYVPFIITDEMKMFYYKGYLLDTCLSAQDNFKAIMDYFKIRY